jgi:hypothetical protein
MALSKRTAVGVEETLELLCQRDSDATIICDCNGDASSGDNRSFVDRDIHVGGAAANADLIRTRMPDPRIHDALDKGSDSELGREVMVCVLRDALAAPLAERSRRVKSEMLRILEERA